jgi:hypothetical protein
MNIYEAARGYVDFNQDFVQNQHHRTCCIQQCKNSARSLHGLPEIEIEIDIGMSRFALRMILKHII